MTVNVLMWIIYIISVVAVGLICAFEAEKQKNIYIAKCHRNGEECSQRLGWVIIIVSAGILVFTPLINTFLFLSCVIEAVKQLVFRKHSSRR